MLDILKDYINENCTPETAEQIEDAHNLFDKLGCDDYERAFEEILATDSNNDTGVTLDKVISLTKDIQYSIVKDHGINLVEDFNLYQANIVIDSLIKIENFEAADSILQVLKSDSNEIECLAEIIALVSGLETEEIMTWFETVTTSLSKKIEEVVATNVIEDKEEVDNSKFETIRKYKNFIDVENCLAEELFRSGLPFGLSFKQYADVIGRDFETLPVDKIVLNMVFLALASSESNRVKEVITEHLEDYISSPDTITKIVVKLTEFLLLFERF